MKITRFDASYSDTLGGTALNGKGVVSTVDPTVTDDSEHGYAVGAHWVNKTTDEEFVLVDGTAGAAVWTSTTAAGMTNPMTTQDDIIVGGASGAPAQLGKGTDGQVLTVDPTTHHILWATPPGGGGVTVQDEGTPLATVADTLDFVGAGVVASGTGTTKTITISGASVADILDLPTAETTATKVLAPDGAGGVEFRAEAGGGGSDLVQVASGAGSVVIPGLKASPDVVPASPNAADDEFGALSGWTTLGTLDVSNVTDFASHVHIGRTAGAWRCDGIYKATPSTPFTVTAKLADHLAINDYRQAALFVGAATPGAALTFGPYFETSQKISRQLWGSPTSRTSYVMTAGAPGPIYLRMVVTSSTDVVCWYSYSGLLYQLAFATTNPGFTIGSVGFVMSDYYGAKVEAAFDWIRFT